MGGTMRTAALGAVLVLLLGPLAVITSAGPASAAAGPSVKLSRSQAGAGGSVTVSGSGWRPEALLMLLICGQSVPSRGVIGGTNSCANADGRAVTTDAKGAFTRKLPVAEPPKPCPCVVHVATVTGAEAQADALFMVAGHSVEPLPKEASGARLSVLTDTRLDGSSGLLTWFGSPPARTLVFTVGNVGTAPVKNPVFQVGTSHGVFAPQWEEQEWHGTVEPGRKARIKLPFELAAGAHGDYTVSLKYGGKVLAEQPWGVGRPWGVTVFWILLCVVVPAAVFRVGMALVDRVRPHRSSGRAGRHRVLRLTDLAQRLPRPAPAPAPPTPADVPDASPAPAALPWFTPDSDPGTATNGQLSAPHENGPTTQTREGHT
ncbi:MULTISPECIES: neocarzinostatin apoprotein domain-containing protein [unclassified Streptomyces]|uniref:neocarzinostatin apoprotein domain-containing protein n=1 Tax=unclassified Streptomyces TaxID=2593676 RepID=UPI003FA38E39